MKKLLAGVALGLVAAVALAQTYTRIPYLRVLNHAEILGNLTVSGTCTGCGAGSPGGADTQVQYNDGGAFGGDAGLTYNETTDALTVAGALSAGGNFTADPGGGTDELTVSSGTTAMIGTTTGGASGGISMTPSNGTFSAVFDNACTVDQTLTMDYQVIGNLVILHAASRSPASCTSDTGIFSTSGTPVPAAIRPANNSHFVVTGFGNNFQDNGTNVSFVCLQIGSSGGMTLLKDPCNSAGSWTGSGTKGAGIGWHVAYMLGNP